MRLELVLLRLDENGRNLTSLGQLTMVPWHGGDQTKLKQPANLLVNCSSQKVIGKKNKETKLQFPFNPGFLTGCVCQLPIVKEMKMWNKKGCLNIPTVVSRVIQMMVIFRFPASNHRSPRVGKPTPGGAGMSGPSTCLTCGDLFLKHHYVSDSVKSCCQLELGRRVQINARLESRGGVGEGQGGSYCAEMGCRRWSRLWLDCWLLR